MNNELLINSAHVLGQYWGLIPAILVCVSWGTLLVFGILKRIAKQEFTNAELITLALGGWPLPVLFISLLIIGLLPFIPAQAIFAAALIIAAIGAGFAIQLARKDLIPDLILPVLFFLTLFFLRLGFVAGASLPPYFDSAEHYRIIQVLLNMQGAQKFTAPVPAYYHLGYHVTVAALAFITNGNPAQVMLLFGQVMLAAIPFPVYFFVRRATGSSITAIIGMTLAAFGWYMPAHAVNWGKYPALLGLLLIQFMLGAMVIKNRWLILAGIIASVLIHTRTVILLGIFGAAWILSGRIQNKRIQLFAAGGAMFGMATLLLDRNQLFGPTFEPYRIWVTLLAVLLAASAARTYPRLIFFSTLAMLGLFAASLIPVSNSYTLLDRPLVEMTLFLPLAFLGGLGSARLPKFAALMVVAVAAFHALAAYNFSPSDCCQLAGRDDVTALNWVKHELPVEARIAIASADLSVDSFSAPMLNTGTDAGIWVAPLTGRTVIALPYYADFLSQDIRAFLCGKQVTHIYIGTRPQSFKFDFVLATPDLYKTVLDLPNAKIVLVKGCGDK